MKAGLRLIVNTKRLDHFSTLLMDLQRLLASKYIDFTLAVLVYVRLYDRELVYLSSELYRVADDTACSQPRSASSTITQISCTYLSTAGDRAFPVAAIGTV
jgi:hypothetical protein